MADDLFTDEEVEFLRSNFSEEHARAALWWRDGMPGIPQVQWPEKPTEADLGRAADAANRAGAEATGMDPETMHATLVDAMTIIHMRRDDAGWRPGAWAEFIRYRNASDAEKQHMEAAWRAGQPQS